MLTDGEAGRCHEAEEETARIAARRGATLTMVGWSWLVGSNPGQPGRIRLANTLPVPKRCVLCVVNRRAELQAPWFKLGRYPGSTPGAGGGGSTHREGKGRERSGAGDLVNTGRGSTVPAFENFGQKAW